MSTEFEPNINFAGLYIVKVVAKFFVKQYIEYLVPERVVVFSHHTILY